ncbi:hypothetical protein GCM10010495_78440 [Kitasatospora herbaricolor]|nr:hypothetical protein [Kitasatospora herbaricolor]GGV48967.1 hypothetical protein GCM10010495_78440 [Kitasatospora herbaricolor]
MTTVRPPKPTRRTFTALASTVALSAGSLGAWAATGGTAQAATLPAPDHIVVVVMENHAYSQVVDSANAPYINNTLKAGGASLTQSYGITHPSEPNYYQLFSGSNQGRTDDSCVSVGSMSAPNLASELIAAGKTWESYNEGLPSQGSTVCGSGDYAQKHNPWFGFNNVPTSTAKTMTQFPTADFASLPKVSFVVPDLCNDMHDCSVGTGDSWIQNNLGAYATWAKAHNSLLVVTFDEDNRLSGNRIPTVFYGANVTPGSSTATTYNHYNMLRTLEDLAGLTSHAGNAASASDITGIWTTGTGNTVTVANPGARSTNPGTAITPVQVSATDSATGQTLTYTATGLPTGLTINSATGRITGTPAGVGTASATVTATDTTGASGHATFTWTVTGTDVALGRPTTASSVEGNNTGLTADKATDGNPATRWASTYTDPQWLQVDLGTTKSVKEVKLTWEAAYGKTYQIQTSNDGTTWTTVYTTTTGDGGTDDLTGLTGSGRYIRLNGTSRGTGYGYSLWSFQVYSW